MYGVFIELSIVTKYTDSIKLFFEYKGSLLDMLLTDRNRLQFKIIFVKVPTFTKDSRSENPAEVIHKILFTCFLRFLVSLSGDFFFFRRDSIEEDRVVNVLFV